MLNEDLKIVENKIVYLNNADEKNERGKESAINYYQLVARPCLQYRAIEWQRRRYAIHWNMNHI